MTFNDILRTAGKACMIVLFPAVAFIPQQTEASAREKISINDSWTFRRGDDTATTAVRLPHCWNNDAYETRDYFRGCGVYTRSLTIPESEKNMRYYLKLDGAAARSSVEVDGRGAGSHAGAYSPHIYDITPMVTSGNNHTLTVTADNAGKDIPPYSADFTFMGGLYRDAWLICLPEIHLDITKGPECGFKATPRRSDDGKWIVDISSTLVNDSPRKAKVTITATLEDCGGRAVACRTVSETVAAGSSRLVSITLDDIRDPELWSPESPALYRLVVSLSAGRQKIDETETLTAFRTFGFDTDNRFLLNGKPYKLRGMCRHQDQRPMGIALSDEQHRRDMALIKDLGANFIRISHYPQDDAVLEMCDRMGLIAWEEIPVIDYVPADSSFADNCETMLRDMIRSHYNHPSIAMWGYMNEILLRMPQSEAADVKPRTLALAHRLDNALHEEDPSRLSTIAFHGSDIYHEAGLSDITDIQGWNLYQGWYGGEFSGFEDFISRQHCEHPSHRLIISEYGAGSDLRLHSFKPVAFDFSMEYQQQYLEHYLPVIEDSAFIAGASHWNFIDFSSANRAESMPHINNKGLVTNDRRPKDVYYYYAAAWHDLAKDTIAHIAVRDWSDRTELASDGRAVTHPVKVYTNLPSVSLRVNGESSGYQNVSNFNAVFDVPLHDGVNLLEVLDGRGRLLDVARIRLRTISMHSGKIDPGLDELAVNVGSDCYYSSPSSGLTWLPDRTYAPGAGYGHTGGSRAVSQDEIRLTGDTPLFQRCLTGLESYSLDVVPGRYEIELSFADVSSPSQLLAYMLGSNAGSGSKGVASMDIIINGKEVERGFAPGVSAGMKTAVTRRYQTTVSDDGIHIDFAPGDGCTTLLTAIKIRKL